MFKALLSVLQYVAMTNKIEVPSNHEELRSHVVTHLVNNSTKLKTKLDKQNLKQYRAMRYKGVLPTDNLLMAVCDLYKVEVHVHHGMEWPVVFKIDKSENNRVIQLQCISGIHYDSEAPKTH